MRVFVCGFMDCEASYIQANNVCAAAISAIEAHDTYVDSGSPPDLDAFMDALGQWREAPSYPFPPYFSASMH